MKHLFLLALLWLAPALCPGQDLDPFQDQNGAPQDGEREGLRFSTTQAWNPKAKAFTRKSAVFLGNWSHHIVMPRPPADSSRRAELELAHLKTLQDERRPEKEEEIRAEIDLKGFRLHDYHYAELTDASKFPKTSRVLLAAVHDLGVVVFTMKKHFDRVRPSILSPDLRPCIEIPGHPAYPSGHATQAFVLAYLLQELAPADREKLLQDAARIAQNREIAGVHYPSDSAAGRLLARQLVDLMLADPEFQKLMSEARTEWPMGE